MRTVIVAVLLFGTAGTASGEAVRQDEAPMVFQRVCNIEPGREAAAAALAREMVDVVGGKYTGVEMSARTGRWMTGFQNIERPVDQILFSERHADDDMRQIFNEILMGDEGVPRLAAGVGRGHRLQQLHRDPLSRTSVVEEQVSRTAHPRSATTSDHCSECCRTRIARGRATGRQEHPARNSRHGRPSATQARHMGTTWS